MINLLKAATTPALKTHYAPRRGGRQEERLYKLVNRRIAVR